MNLTNIVMSKIFEMTPQGVGKWKKEKRPIISFLEKYCTKNDLEEFLQAGKIQKFEKMDYFLNGLYKKCEKIYFTLERFVAEYKYPDVDYSDGSLMSNNAYMNYLKPFLIKYSEEIQSFQDLENFKRNFFDLAIAKHFEYRNNGIKEPFTTFQILAIINELTNYELHYFLNEFFDKILEDLKS